MARRGAERCAHPAQCFCSRSFKEPSSRAICAHIFVFLEFRSKAENAQFLRFPLPSGWAARRTCQIDATTQYSVTSAVENTKMQNWR